MRLFLPLLLAGSAFAADNFDKDKALKALAAFESAQEAARSAMTQLREACGLVEVAKEVQDLEPISDTGLSKTAREKTDAGIKALQGKDLDKAKTAFQAAYEAQCDSATTQFNLGLIHLRQNNVVLAKKMLRQALDTSKTTKVPLLGSERLIAYLDDAPAAGPSPKLDAQAAPSKERTELSNKKKQLESLLKVDRKLATLKQVYSLLQTIGDVCQQKTELAPEFLPFVASTWEDLGDFDKASATLAAYETAMAGKELPESHFSKLLSLKAKKQEQGKTWATYQNASPKAAIAKRCQRNLDELSVFATQIDDFVKELDDSDADFQKLCQRLKEFRWGQQPDKHVVIANKAKELIYSSLPGAVALDRYRDSKNRAFFVDICQMGASDLAGPHYFPLQLQVNGQLVDYAGFWIYAPKQEVFIVVRVPESELAN